MKYNNIKKYLLYCVAIYSVYCVILIGAYIAFEGWLALVVGFILYIPSKVLVRIFARNTIESILFSELDATKFKLVISSTKWLRPPMFYLLLSEYYNGNYSKAISLIDSFLRKSKSKKFKNTIIFLKARIYFEQDNIDSLRDLCSLVESSRKDFEKSQNLERFHFYRNYVEGRYIECREFCDRVNESLVKKSSHYKLAYVNNLFDFAVVYYKSGDFSKAKEYFLYLIEYAPRLYIAKLSEEYLKALDEKNHVEIGVSGSDEKYEKLSKASRKKIVLLVVFIVSLLLLIIPKLINVYDSHKQNQEVKTLEQKICMSLDEQYKEYHIVEYFNLTINNEITDTICVVKDEEDNYDIGFLVEKSNGENVEFSCVVNNVQNNNSYYLKSMDGIHFVLIDVRKENEILSNDYEKTLQITMDTRDVSIGFKIVDYWK